MNQFSVSFYLSFFTWPLAKLILFWSNFKGPKQGSKSTLIRRSGCMAVICVRVSYSKRSLGTWSAVVNLRSVLGSLRIYGKQVSDKNNCKQRTERMRRFIKKERELKEKQWLFQQPVSRFSFFSEFIFSVGISNNFSIKEPWTKPSQLQDES